MIKNLTVLSSKSPKNFNFLLFNFTAKSQKIFYKTSLHSPKSKWLPRKIREKKYIIYVKSSNYLETAPYVRYIFILFALTTQKYSRMVAQNIKLINFQLKKCINSTARQSIRTSKIPISVTEFFCLFSFLRRNKTTKIKFFSK